MIRHPPEVPQMPSREPDWETEEFLTVLQNLQLSDEELARKVKRSRDAVSVVRAGILDYARGKTHTTLLSDLMRDLIRGREHLLPKKAKKDNHRVTWDDAR